MKPLVSIIIPVFNVEKYIDKCVSSIISQTYSRLEIIIVDDGSTDSSPEKCDQWAEKDERIQVMHQENRGLPGAREAGVRASTGEYVLFVDSDDWIAERSVELLMECAISSNVDIVYFDFNRVSDVEDVSVHNARSGFPDERRVPGSEAFQMLLNGKLGWNIWRMMIRSTVFRNSDIVFPIGVMMGEDLDLTYQVLGYAKSVYFLPYSLYYYYDRPSSSVNTVTTKTRDKTMSDLMIIYENLEKYVVSYYPEFVNLCNAMVVTQFFSYLSEIIAKKENGPSAKRWKNMLRWMILQHGQGISSMSKKNLIRIFVVWSRILWIHPVACFFYKRVEESR